MYYYIYLNTRTKLFDEHRDHEVPDEGLSALAAHLLLVQGGEDDRVEDDILPAPVGQDPGSLQEGRHPAPVIIHPGAGGHCVPVGGDHH